MVIKLLMAVRLTESAVSPFARCAIKLEVGPPGHATRIITPTAIPGTTGMNEAIRKPSKGKISNWLTNPTAMALGWINIRLKSFISSDNPIPSIITINEIARIAVDMLSIVS